MTRRACILEEARAWLWTPYQHQASARGVGCDCLGLVRGVWRAVIGPEPERAPSYSADWSERDAGEPLLTALEHYFEPRRIDARAPGDVLAFRITHGAAVKHVAIQSGDESMIHAYWGRAVIEAPFSPWWRARLAFVFSFPGA